MGDVPLVKIDALCRRRGRVGHIKQMQPVRKLVAGARHRDVVEHGVEVKPAERHGVPFAGRQQPALFLQPWVGLLGLFAVNKALAEQPVVVVEPHAVARQAERGDRIEEAGGQPAQPAVAQGRLGLGFLKRGQAAAHAVEQGADFVKQAERQQIVAEQLAEQKLGREIVELALPRGGGPAGGQVLRQRQQRVVKLGIGAGFGRAGIARLGDGGQLLFDGFHTKILLL